MTETKLPAPKNAPEGSDIVIYDGNCVFCTAQVEKLHRWDSRKQLAFVSLHDPYVKNNYGDLSHDELMKQMYVVSADGKRRGGADAFRYLAAKIPRLWILVPFLYIPFTLPIWQWLYGIVARQRYRIAGKSGDTCDDGACDIHFKK